MIWALFWEAGGDENKGMMSIEGLLKVNSVPVLHCQEVIMANGSSVTQGNFDLMEFFCPEILVREMDKLSAGDQG